MRLVLAAARPALAHPAFPKRRDDVCSDALFSVAQRCNCLVISGVYSCENHKIPTQFFPT